MSGRIRFVMNLDRCLGCQSCEVACKQENGIGVGLRWRRVVPIMVENLGVPFEFFLSSACNHCEDPACLNNCPTGAYRRTEDGIVLHDQDRCIGCRMCTMVCPYGAPQYNEGEGRVEKCNLCVDRIDAGLKPACVQTCPAEALLVEEIPDERPPETINSVIGFPDSSITKPSVRFVLPRITESERQNWDRMELESRPGERVDLLHPPSRSEGNR